jgi:hypothetical protein
MLKRLGQLSKKSMVKRSQVDQLQLMKLGHVKNVLVAEEVAAVVDAMETVVAIEAATVVEMVAVDEATRTATITNRLVFHSIGKGGLR